MSALPVQIVSDPQRAAVLLHPTRLAILRELQTPNSAAGLARVLNLPRQQLNYHLRELESGGHLQLVEEKRRGNATERIVQATATSYLISPEVLGHLGANPEQIRDKFSLSYLVATAAKAISDLARLRKLGENQGKPVPTMTIRTEIRFASPARRREFAEELANEIARLTAKFHDAEAKQGRATTLFLGLHPTVTEKPSAKESP